MKKLLNLDNENIEIENLTMNEQSISFSFAGKEWRFQIIKQDSQYKKKGNFKGKNFSGYVGNNTVIIDGMDFLIEDPRYTRVKSTTQDHGAMISPMPGKILKVYIENNQIVKEGEPLLVMEAMKMEHTIKANKNGIIKKIHCAEGSLVDGGVELVEIED